MGSDKVEEIIERVRKARTAEELRKTAEEAIRWEEMDPGMERGGMRSSGSRPSG
jgi:hypothetical protein